MAKLRRFGPGAIRIGNPFDDPLFSDPFPIPSLIDLFRNLIPEDKTSLDIDISEEGDNYIVKADVPGAKKEEVSANIDNGILTITRKVEEKEEKKDEKEVTYYLRERTASKSRSILLPDDINTSKIKAVQAEGVLTITIPKAETKKPEPQEIPIS
ncbi:Hsp20/alpha crystallin family protein [Patescibacteria group bacterium]